ncbi:MAG: radical SAM protein [Proteobacteria bacterium]|nr:radical SAM protein [Pseudomonadota bacterium]MCP4919283.1 radical SAM protein [Pseudomonadota bacterium]
MFRDDLERARPVYAVWELTLKCDQACRHCGSRAGPVREAELDEGEVLDTAAQLVSMGVREVTLIGGEAYLHPQLEDVVRVLASGGVRATMQTGGRRVTRAMCRRLKQAGLAAIGVSIDGLRESHELQRGVPGGFDACIETLEVARGEGLLISANTQINRLNMGELEELAEQFQGLGVLAWQVQLTVPMGRAADRPDWIVQPWMVLEIVERLASIQRSATERGVSFNVFAGNNIGYFGPHEAVLRSRQGTSPTHWNGCRAGMQVLGIEADGVVKGCPSLPTAPYTGGNIRDVSLQDIWDHAEEMAFARDRDTSELWAFCETCYYADTCRAGCSFTAHTTLGRRGNNPFCWYRADQLKRRGVRERLVQVEDAPGRPFDFGRFELVEEPTP